MEEEGEEAEEEEQGSPPGFGWILQLLFAFEGRANPFKGGQR